MTKDDAKSRVKLLVEKFNSYKEQGLLKQYNEDNTCKDFILPLFRALGWGVETSKEVEGQKIVSNGRVDYSFYLDGIPKFFLEAKAIPEDLNKESYIKQAIDYSYNRGVTWAVLSNFEGLKVFNAEWHTAPAKACVLNLSVSDYLTDFDLLWELSKEGIEQELLYEGAKKIGQVAVKEPVGERLYKDLTAWRELFFKYITGYHKNFNFAQVDEIIQRILNRFVFIRTCEDRNIEPPHLLPLVREWRAGKRTNLQQNIKELFRDFDSWYNSKLFAHHLCDDIDIEDTPYAEVIEGLYGSKDEIVKYDFNAIGVDVLGRVYEQYLGYVAKTVEPKRKKQLALEGFENELIKIGKEKKRRKEQGIYYTPAFIVDYIVKNSLKPILDKCVSVGDLKKIKVLDPACGSGSFLIKALELINDKYKEFNYKGDELTKIEILNENIYGVDLDEQAVEISRLNLSLNSLDRRMELPILKNIRNGNSLISGTDEELKKYFGEDYRDKKPFNWQEEFPEVFEQGGFDVIIGNPPYIRVDSLDEKDKLFWKNALETGEGKYDLYYLFMEKGINLLKENGNLGFIIPNKFCVADSAKKLREKILKESSVVSLVSVSKIDVFKDASNYPVILFLEKGAQLNKIFLGFAREEKEITKANFIKYSIGEKEFKLLPDKIIPINTPREKLNLVLKLLRIKENLNEYLDISEGLRIQREFESESREDTEIVKQYQFEKYTPIKEGSFISKENLLKVINKESRRYLNIVKDKIIITEDALCIIATLDQNKCVPQGGVYFGTLKKENISLKYLLGLLNSRLLSFIYETLFGGMHMGGGYLRYRTNFLNKLPIVFNKNQEQTLVALVDKMLESKRRVFVTVKDSNEYENLQKESKMIDQKIDQEVYHLYELTPEEIEIVGWVRVIF